MKDGSIDPAGNQVPKSQEDNELICGTACRREDGAFPQLPL